MSAIFLSWDLLPWTPAMSLKSLQQWKKSLFSSLHPLQQQLQQYFSRLMHLRGLS